MKISRTVGIVLAIFSLILLSGMATSAEAQGRGRGNAGGQGNGQGNGQKGKPQNTHRGNEGNEDRGNGNRRGDRDTPPIVVNPVPGPGNGQRGPGANNGQGQNHGQGQNNGVRDGGHGIGNGNGQGKGQGWWRRELKGQNSQVKSGKGDNSVIPYPTIPNNRSPRADPDPGPIQPGDRDLPKPKKPVRRTQRTAKTVKRTI